MATDPVSGLPTNDVTILLKDRSRTWAGHWAEGSEDVSRRELLSSFGTLGLIPPLEPHHLEKAAKSFKSTTSSRDGFHPKHFSVLSTQGLESLCTLFNCFERIGVIPTQMGGVLVSLIPKPEGGDRPIGLLQGSTRLWHRPQ